MSVKRVRQLWNLHIYNWEGVGRSQTPLRQRGEPDDASSETLVGLGKTSQEGVAGDFVPVGSSHLQVEKGEPDSHEKAP